MTMTFIWLLFVFVSLSVAVQFYTSYSHVPIGGGGWCEGAVFHPTQPGIAFVHCDIGGAFLLNISASDGSMQWTAITDSFYQETAHSSIFGMAVNGTALFMASGGPGSVLSEVDVSYDLGTTWQSTGYKGGPYSANANAGLKWAGERISLSPTANILLLGIQQPQGYLYRLDTSSGIWTTVGPQLTTGGGGWTFTLFLPNGTAFAGAYSKGIYMSTNDGMNWTLVQGTSGPQMPLRAAATPSALFVAGDDGIWRLDLATTNWTQLLPDGNASTPYCGIAAHGNFVVAGTFSFFQTGPSRFYYSNNSGNSWHLFPVTSHQGDVPWWPANEFYTAVNNALLIDPFNPYHVLKVDWFGYWYTNAFFSGVWTTSELLGPSGHEEVAVDHLQPMPSNPNGIVLLTATRDVIGFAHKDPTKQAAVKITVPKESDGESIAVCPLNSSIVAMSFADTNTVTGTLLLSQDSGQTYNPFAGALPAGSYSGQVAFNSKNCSNIVWIPYAALPYYTADGGAHWIASSAQNAAFSYSQSQSGVPSIYARFLAADPFVAGRFYWYIGHTLSISSDGGASWVNSTATLPPIPSYFGLVVAPVQTGGFGQVWLALNGYGLYVSSDGGMTFTNLSTVNSANYLDFGPPLPSVSTNYTLYMFGRVGTDQYSKLWLSTDYGSTWVSLDSPSNHIPRATDLKASSNPGEIYIGTTGRGVFRVVVTTSQSTTSSGAGLTTSSPATTSPTATTSPALTGSPVTGPTTTASPATTSPTGGPASGTTSSPTSNAPAISFLFTFLCMIISLSLLVFF